MTWLNKLAVKKKEKRREIGRKYYCASHKKRESTIDAINFNFNFNFNTVSISFNFE